MSERDEINLRQEQQALQAKQNATGIMTAVLCAVSISGFIYFITTPGEVSAAVLVSALALLLIACLRMFFYAAKVVEVRNSLQPVPIRADIIDVEVIDSPRRQNGYPAQRRNEPRW